MSEKVYGYIGWWVLSGVILVALNAAVWISGRTEAPSIATDPPSPAFWAGSVLLVIVVVVLDIIWLGLFVLWLGSRRMRATRGEHLVPTSSEPHDKPKRVED